MKDTQFDLHLFSELYDVHPQAIVWSRVIWSEDGATINDLEYTYCNDEGLRYLNLTREQQQAGLRISNSPTLTPELRKSLLEEATRIYQTGKKSETSIYNPVLNKYARVIRTRLREGILSIIQDRTEENRTIRQMEEQKRLLDNILKRSSNGISVGEMIRDKSGTIVDIRTILVNDAAVQLTGIPKDVYLSKTASEVDPSFIGSPYFAQCIRCMETGEPFLIQYHLMSVGKWLEVSVSRMDDDHQIYIFTDVTTVKETQLALEKSAAQLQTIINRTQSGILIIKPEQAESGEITDFRFVLANKALASYVHQEPDTLVGELGSKWFTGYKKNGLFDLFCDTFLHNRVNRFDYHYNDDGIDAWIDMMCTRLHDEVLVTFTDYTPVKKLQLELQEAVEDLKQSNKSLEEFAYAASHDLQEPLRKIHTFTDRLKSTLLPHLKENEKLLFERVENATHRMRQLIGDLLAYSQVSRKGGESKEVNLMHILEETLQDLEASIQETGAVVAVENLPTIRGNERQLRQLFQNLIGNAIKYRKPDITPAVSVSCDIVHGKDVPGIAIADNMDKMFYQIAVSDNGIGFEQEYADSIFEIFQRLHGRAEYEGTGIGLAIVQQVVRNHDGYIRAVGKPGVGATFTVWLPA